MANRKQTIKFCTNCGSKIEGNLKFCTNCGEKFNTKSNDAKSTKAVRLESDSKEKVNIKQVSFKKGNIVKNKITEKLNPMIKKWYFWAGILAVIVIIVAIFSVVGTVSSCANNNWPKEGLVTLLPNPYKPNINIKKSDDKIFECEIENTSQEEFKKYSENCKKAGFNNDSNLKNGYFGAKDEAGNQLNIWWNSWDDSRTQMSIKVESSEYITSQNSSKYENETLYWPTDGIAALLPKPSSQNGHVYSNSAGYFHCYVAKTDNEAFNEYISKCKEKGFTVNFSSYSTSFSAKDNSGHSLTIYLHEKQKEMSISLSKQ